MPDYCDVADVLLVIPILKDDIDAGAIPEAAVESYIGEASEIAAAKIRAEYDMDAINALAEADPRETPEALVRYVALLAASFTIVRQAAQDNRWNSKFTGQLESSLERYRRILVNGALTNSVTGEVIPRGLLARSTEKSSAEQAAPCTDFYESLLPECCDE